MQTDYLNSVYKALSFERLEKYRLEGDDDLDVLARYAWNIALCEALYPALQTLEIALRNSLYLAAADAFKNPLWFTESPPMLERELGTVRKVKSRLEKHLGHTIQAQEAGRIVAELNFSFWIHLFDGRYEKNQVLWPELLRKVFPYMPRRILTRKMAAERLNLMGQLRNRVFHHEPIWHRNIEDQYKALLQAINWVSPVLSEQLEIIDRFSEVFHQGYKIYRKPLSELIGDF